MPDEKEYCQYVEGKYCESNMGRDCTVCLLLAIEKHMFKLTRILDGGPAKQQTTVDPGIYGGSIVRERKGRRL